MTDQGRPAARKVPSVDAPRSPAPSIEPLPSPSSRRDLPPGICAERLRREGFELEETVDWSPATPGSSAAGPRSRGFC